MRLFLARHGETDWNRERRWQGHTDIPLSARGREQAAALGARLAGLGIGHIRSSDLQRARETAEIVARTLGIQAVSVDPRLRERCFGVFEGLTADECAVQFPDVWLRYQDDRRIMPPGAEPHDEVVARLTRAVAEAAEQARAATTAAASEDPALLLVGHGGSIRVLLHATLGRPFPPLDNGCLLEVTLEGGRLTGVENLG